MIYLLVLFPILWKFILSTNSYCDPCAWPSPDMEEPLYSLVKK